MSPSPVPPEPPSALASGAWVQQMLHGAAALGLVDQLASGTQAVEELADACGADRDALLRLMRGLASLGLCEETAPRRFAPTPMASLLRAQPPSARRQFSRRPEQEPPPGWEAWLHSLRSGDHAFRDRHGCSVLAWCRRHPQRAQSLSVSMGRSQAPTARPAGSAQRRSG